jgi:hypothetical protein
MVPFSNISNPPNKVILGLCAGYAIIVVRAGESHFENGIFPSHERMFKEVVPKSNTTSFSILT